MVCTQTIFTITNIYETGKVSEEFLDERLFPSDKDTTIDEDILTSNTNHLPRTSISYYKAELHE